MFIVVVRLVKHEPIVQVTNGKVCVAIPYLASINDCLAVNDDMVSIRNGEDQSA